MPGIGNDRGRTVSVSSDEWHDAAYHNAARRHHHRLQEKKKRAGFDVHLAKPADPLVLERLLMDTRPVPPPRNHTLQA